MLNEKQIKKFLNDSVGGKLSVEEQVEFLKNFTPEKVTARDVKIFADFMLSHMLKRLNMPGCIDVCGTGGSGLPRINTSTIASFILAELGVKVAKHGNKAASGRFGSFDLLESLGVEVNKSPEELERLYMQNGLAFIFARNFHPVMKFFAEARKVFGKPTIFNILGPLLNPACPLMQVIGTSFKGRMRLIAESCKLLGKKHVVVVRGRDGLDEVSLSDKTDVVELKNGKFLKYTICPENFGLKNVNFKKISGGDAEFNRKIALDILDGKCKSPHADLVYVNCALALKLVGRARALEDGYKMAKNGNILRKIAASKMLRCDKRSLYNALRGGKKALIAEIKFASPSNGVIKKGSVSEAEKIAKIYEKNGASAISVLTDEKYFNGSFEYLKAARQATLLPVLCKDFVVEEYQIYKAHEYGADAILLIANLLEPERLKKFLKIVESLKMEALVEVHDEADLKKVLKTNAEIIGINNRNLTDFKIDLKTTNRLIRKIPTNKIIVSESGINSREDLKKLDSRVNAVLIGTAIMKSKNISKKIHELT